METYLLLYLVMQRFQYITILLAFMRVLFQGGVYLNVLTQLSSIFNIIVVASSSIAFYFLRSFVVRPVVLNFFFSSPIPCKRFLCVNSALNYFLYLVIRCGYSVWSFMLTVLVRSGISSLKRTVESKSAKLLH